MTLRRGGFAKAWKFQGYIEHKREEFDSHILDLRRIKVCAFQDPDLSSEKGESSVSSADLGQMGREECPGVGEGIIGNFSAE